MKVLSAYGRHSEVVRISLREVLEGQRVRLCGAGTGPNAATVVTVSPPVSIADGVDAGDGGDGGIGGRGGVGGQASNAGITIALTQSNPPGKTP